MNFKQKVLALCGSLVSLFLFSSCNVSEPEEPKSDLNGYGAIRLLSTNSGTNWDLQFIKYTPSGWTTNDTLKSGDCIVSASDDFSSFLVSGHISDNKSKLVLSQNKGLSWNQVLDTMPVCQDLQRQSYSNNVYAAYTNMYRSSNLGSTWVSTNFPGYTIQSIGCAYENVVVALPYATTRPNIRSTDNGLTWEFLSVLDSTHLSYDCAFIGNLECDLVVALTEKDIWRSSDTATSWTRVNPAGYDGSGRSVSFVDPVGIIVGVGGLILRSTDRGLHWTSVSSGTTKNLTKVVCSSSAYWAVGSGVILRSNDQGRTWTTVRNATDETYNDIVVSEGGVMVVGSRIK